MPKWTPRDARLALCVAIVAVVFHHLISPHGERLKAPLGHTITLTRTVYGWNVQDGAQVTKAKDVRVNSYAENLD